MAGEIEVDHDVGPLKLVPKKDPFVTGDVVRLTSGESPRMTVEEVLKHDEKGKYADVRVRCIWFTNGILCKEIFYAKTLNVVVKNG